MGIETLQTSIIRTDGGTQPRIEMNLFTVDDYADEMRKGVAFPPLVVFFDGEYYWLADGFHRLGGAIKAERDDIECEVKEGSRRDAVLYSVGANSEHGLRRTNEDKRRAARTLLYDDEWGQRSNNWIAQQCGVSLDLINRLRIEKNELSGSLNESLSEKTYVTKHGTIATMNTANIGTAIVPEARELLRDTDVAEDRRELNQLRRMVPQEQIKVAALIASGEAVGVRDAQRCITYDRVHEMTLAESINGKFSVIYADPPWNYGNSGIIGDDNYGHAERHYKSMLTDDICALPVPDYTTTNAVLFLWATSPLLDDALRVIKAWGFDYKTSFIWDKVKHNFGHYNSVRHEFLLLGTRGSYTPECRELHDSVIELERTDKHSEKPQYFRELIEKLYPSGSKIELFAREEHDGWTSWGNEVGGEPRE